MSTLLFGISFLFHLFSLILVAWTVTHATGEALLVSKSQVSRLLGRDVKIEMTVCKINKNNLNLKQRFKLKLGCYSFEKF